MNNDTQPAQMFPEPCSTGTLTAPSNFRSICWNLSVRVRNLWHWRTKWAVSHLSKQLQKDPEFRQSWHANIAMTIYDDSRTEYTHSKRDLGWKSHIEITQANHIADRLMRHLFRE